MTNNESNKVIDFQWNIKKWKIRKIQKICRIRKIRQNVEKPVNLKKKPAYTGDIWFFSRAFVKFPFPMMKARKGQNYLSETSTNQHLPHKKITEKNQKTHGGKKTENIPEIIISQTKWKISLMNIMHSEVKKYI